MAPFRGDPEAVLSSLLCSTSLMMLPSEEDTMLDREVRGGVELSVGEVGVPGGRTDEPGKMGLRACLCF